MLKLTEAQRRVLQNAAEWESRDLGAVYLDGYTKRSAAKLVDAGLMVWALGGDAARLTESGRAALREDGS